MIVVGVITHYLPWPEVDIMLQDQDSQNIGIRAITGVALGSQQADFAQIPDGGSQEEIPHGMEITPQ